VRRLAIVVLCLGGASGVARAQAPASNHGYVEGVAQSAFGNVTSQSFGLEFGVTVGGNLQVFVDAGRVRDTAPTEQGAAAQSIAGYLSQTQSNVTFSSKQPVTFGLAGIRYRFATSVKVEPYVLAGAGLARVEKAVTFAVNGNDVTNTAQQYGIVLGSDLSGSETKPMLTAGAGVVWPVWQSVIVDFQYRYGRVLTSDSGLNVSRAGIGLGIRF
jgi:opacity protein-like surface antigen